MSNAKPSREQRPPSRPREEVMASILHAAEELLASEGIEQVTLRQIADRAGVQHGLITRHFGTKQELLREVIDRGVKEGLAELRSRDGAFEGSVALLRYMQKNPAALRVTAQAMINGVSPEVAMSRFPNIAELLRRLEDEGRSIEDARVVAALGNAFVFGVVLLRPWLLASTALEGEDDEALFDAGVLSAMKTLMEIDLPKPPE
ncbi:MAG: helix-turn-helix domain containing protein [Actinobacteria bacterium]|nr:helix-turn-helix domain containing protein [Actinomycetota bacterium]